MILIAGLPGSGKTTISKMMTDLGLPVVSMGDIVREQALKQGRSSNVGSMNRFMVELRDRFGEGVVAELTMSKVKEMPQGKIVIDGLRSLEEYEIFKNAAKKVVLVVVDADIQTRFKRLSRRGRSDDPKSISEVRTRDKVELGVGVSGLLSKEGIHVKNNKDLESLRTQVLSIAESLSVTRSRTP